MTSKIRRLSFIEWNNAVFSSFIRKINLDILLIVFLDSLFYIVSGGIVIFWMQRLQEKINAFNLPQDAMSLGLSKAQQLAGDVKSFYFLIIFSVILVLIVIIFLASILKGMIWARTLKSKISLRIISKFLVLNLVWMGFWFIIVFLISILVEPSAVFIFFITALLLAFYLTNTLYTLFFNKNNGLNAISAAIKTNISKIHLFLLPYLVISSLGFIIIKLVISLKFPYSSFLLAFVLIAYVAVARYYFSELVLALDKY